MVLPPVVVLLGPTGVAVFLSAYGGVRIELLGPLAAFDALVLLGVVTLARGFGEAGVDDAFDLKMRAKGFEEFAASFAYFGFEALLEVPERFGIRDGIADAQAEEAFEAGAVEDLLLGGVVTEAVEPLQHEDFEHEHGVKGRLAAFLPVARGVAGKLFE